MATDPRPLAPAQTERLARDVFATHLSPGEYAARHGDPAGLFGYQGWRYRDAQLGKWIDAVAAICADPRLLHACRERLASSTEHT